MNNNKTSLWITFVIGLIIFIPCALIAQTHRLDGFEARIFYDFDNLNLSAGFVTAAKWITEGLGSAFPIAGCVIIPLIFRNYRLAWRFFFTAGSSTVAFYIIKKIINEPRPVVMLHGHLHQRVIETGPSFPSGHETAATALALTLWFILPIRWRWISILWITLVALSRLYLGVHTPTDVIGGFALGLMAVCFVRLLPNRISQKLRLN